jgi:hypothetical protein
VEHFVTSTKNCEQNIVVDVLRVVDVLGGRAVRLLSSEARNGGREDEDVAPFRLEEYRPGVNVMKPFLLLTKRK